MDSLEKFKQANITQDVIAEINNLTNEQLEQLSNEKVTLLIRDKKNKTTSHTGLATYKSLLSLSKLNLKQKYEVVGFVNKKTNILNQATPQTIAQVPQPEFIAPETPLIEETIEFVNLEDEATENTEAPVEVKKRVRRKNN